MDTPVNIRIVLGEDDDTLLVDDAELVYPGGHYDCRAQCAKLVTAERPPGTVPQSGRTYLHSIAYGRAVFMTFLDLE